MECRKCRSQNPQNAKFCIECGARLEPVCPGCGQTSPAGSKFCNACGMDLRQTEQAPAKDFSQRRSYTPRFITETYLSRPMAVEGERKPVSVMFVDVANSTRLFEKLDPEEVHWIMDRCFKLLIDEVHRYEGTINQFMGDGIMALFGAPIAHEDHALRACRAALAIQKAMVAFGDKILGDYGVVFQVRIGLNSGPVVVGAIGDNLRMDFTAVSNTVHLACRFESLAKPGTIVLSRATHRLVQNYFNLRYLGRAEVKGVNEPQEVFELVNTGEASTRLEASAKRGLTDFVGRVDSMAALMAAYEKVKRGSGQVVGIVGEAGVGKSRLLHEFKNRLVPGDFLYLEGRCIHFGGTIPYLPILDILKSYFDIGEAERDTISRKRVQQKIQQLGGRFLDMLPPILDLLSLPVDDERYFGLEPRQRKDRIFEALRDLTVRGCQHRPLVLAVEDLHWIDKASEEFLDYLIGWLANIGVLLILLHRPEYTYQWANQSCYTRIGLIQLSPQSSTELLRSILKEGEPTPEVIQLILKRSAGNPLFMEELTHALVEDGTIEKRDRQFVLCGSEANIQIPDTIEGIIAARIDRLDENVKKIVQLASVIGREFTFRVLQAISEMDTDIKAQLLNLQGLELIYEKSLFPELEFVFKHALTVEVTYNSLLSRRKREIHRSIGRAVEALFAANLEEYYEVLAYHYTRGRQIDKAARYLKYSGQKAARNHALWEAYGFYRQAVEMLNKLPESPETMGEMLAVIQLMRVPMTLLGFPEGCLRFLQLGERLAAELGDTRGLASLYALMGTFQSHAGNHADAIRYAEEGLAKALKARDIELIAPLAVTICTSYSATSRYGEIARMMPKIIDLIEQAGREADLFSITLNPYSYICGGCGAALGHLGIFDSGEAYLAKAFDNAEKIGHAATSGATRFNFGWWCYAKGSYIDARQHLEQCIRHFEEAQWHLGVSLAQCLLGHVNLLLGEPETGVKQAEQGIQMYHASGIKLYLSWCDWVLGSVHLEVGDPVRAMKYMEEAMRLARKNEERGIEGLALVGLGRVMVKGAPSRLSEAEAHIVSGLAILNDLQMKPWEAQGRLFLGELYQEGGVGDRAVETLETSATMFRQMGMTHWQERAANLLGRVRR